MTQVILINPPVYYQKNGNPNSLDASYPPLGLLYLAAFLEKENISTKILDIGAEKNTLKQTLSFIKRHRPKVVGISTMTPLLQGATTLAKEIKKIHPKAQICLGGPHLSADPGFIKRNPYFDFGITGEAEATFTNLVKKILKGKKVTGIHVGKPIQDLSLIPHPAYHLIDKSLYLKKASMMTTRGCPFNCYYCSRPAIDKKVRLRQPKDIADEMDKLYDDCKGEYLFQDDTLTIIKKHTIAFCKELLSRPRKYHWTGYTRVDLVDEPLLKLMSKAGCQGLTFGIETGDQNLRKKIVKKNFTNKQVEKIIKLCNKYSIDADAFFMLGHPTETPSQVEKTINFILKHNFNIIGVSIPTPFPGSALWHYAVKDNVISLNYIDQYARGKAGQGYAGVYPIYFPKTLSPSWLYIKRRQLYHQRQSIIFSRGCPYACYYCSRPAISKKTRYRSAQNLIDEIKATYPYHQGQLDFQDDTLTLNRQKVLRFCQLVKKEGLKLNWRCNTRIDLVDLPLLKAIQQAGCSLIHFGIEAGNEKIRRQIVKKGNFTNQDIKKVISLCKNLKIEVAGYFILGHPQETKKHLNQTKEMILNYGFDLIGLSIPTPFPGSALYQMALKMDIINNDIIDQFAKKELGQGYAGVYPVFTSTKVSPQYVYRLMQQINRSFYLKLSIILSKFAQNLKNPSKFKQDFLDLLSLIFKGMSSRKPYIKPGQIK